MADGTAMPEVPRQRGQHNMEAFRAASVQSRFADITGQRFGMTEVLAYLGKGHWYCRCDCGAEHRAYAGNLKTGRHLSCGCLRRVKTPTDQRFWEKVDKTPDDCWEWRAGRDYAGYGTFNVNLAGDGSDRARMAHRYSYELHYGPIPDGMVVMHQCDNPPCVRPDHLRVGTQDENMLDKKLKGRGRTDDYKLTDTDVVELRAQAARGVRLADIARQFGIDRGYASAIANGRRR